MPLLVTRDGTTLRFYDDLLEGKAVAISLMYTTCKDECPLETARLVQTQKLPGDRVGKDLFFSSITSGPRVDTPRCCGPADVVVCLGDTLTHLPSRETVDELFRRVAGRLSSGGWFILSLRDYATRALEGPERFILVRSQAERILTCFLEYAPGVVYVHDVLHSRSAPDGPWALRVSAYPKLRLAPEWIAAGLGEVGLRVAEQGVDSGQVVLAARKAPAPVA